MFEYAQILLEQFMSYLPTWSAIFVALGIAGNVTFRKI